MTELKKLDQHSERTLPPVVGIFAIFLLVCPAFLFPKEISRGVLFGIKLCVTNVIPSVFPFFIIADAVFSLSGNLSNSFIGKIFSRIFHQPPEAVGAFVAGCVCGFPVGVKIASELYERGSVTKSEAEHLIGFSNNPSLAFVTSAVGVGMLGSLKAGIILYSSVVISAVAVGIFFRTNVKKSEKIRFTPRQKFNFTESVKNAGFSSLTVSSYIIFFSALSGLLIKVLGEGIVGLVGVMLCEVSGGAAFITSSEAIVREVALVLTSAALAFSGFSVHLQARSLAAGDISFIKYYVMKLTQSAVSAAVTAALLFFGA